MLNLSAGAFRVSELRQSSSVSPHLQAINSYGWLNLEKYIQILTTSHQFYRSRSFLGHHHLSWFVVTPPLPPPQTPLRSIVHTAAVVLL